MPKINVLDHGFVDLVDWMGGDLTCVNAAKVSFGNRSRDLGAKEIKLINYLAEHKHMSPFRHVQLQFHIKMPEFLARQFFKHLVGCAYTSGDQAFNDTPWNEISGRYVDMGEVEFYYPETWRQQSKDNKQASEGSLEGYVAESATKDYDHLITQAKVAYKNLLNRGVAKEQVRMVLPLSFYTEFYWTASLQAVVNLIQLRQHPGAQYEIQEYAKVIKELADHIAPISLRALLK